MNVASTISLDFTMTDGPRLHPSITRGGASDVVGSRLAENPDAQRAHRRATLAQGARVDSRHLAEVP